MAKVDVLERSRVCAVQMRPELMDPEASMKKAKAMLKDLKPGSVDFILFPEMAFTGYEFRSKEEIAPYVEPPQGRTYEFCRSIATSLNACVAAGYPEHAKDDLGEDLFYNSMCVVNEEGDLVTTYRKVFLYETDKTWAAKGNNGFRTCMLRGLKVGLGICMDLNPEDFDLQNDNFALASFCFNERVDMILFSTNWLLSEEQTETSLHRYWLWRLTPLLHRKCVFVAANRIGKEREANFAGESCVIDLQTLTILASVGPEDEALVIATLPTHGLVPAKKLR